MRGQKILSDNSGVALPTVILVIAILMILAAVAIETTGSDIINAGNNMSAEQTVNYSNSAMNLVLSQIGTNLGTNAGIGIPEPGMFYYTAGGNNTTINSSSSYQTLTASNINSIFSSQINSQNGNNAFAYEISGTYGSIPGYSINTYQFYNGQVQVLARNTNSGNTVQAGMTFSYGPIQTGY